MVSKEALSEDDLQEISIKNEYLWLKSNKHT